MKFGGPNSSNTNVFPPEAYLTDSIKFSTVPLHRDPSFLHREYVENGLSTSQIADKIFSSKEAVRRGLKQAGIPMRKPNHNHGRNDNARFGSNLEHPGEARALEVIEDLKGQGMTLRQISQFLNKIGVPTKRAGKKWHPQMVKRVLERNNKREGA